MPYFVSNIFVIIVLCVNAKSSIVKVNNIVSKEQAIVKCHIAVHFNAVRGMNHKVVIVVFTYPYIAAIAPIYFRGRAAILTNMDVSSESLCTRYRFSTIQRHVVSQLPCCAVLHLVEVVGRLCWLFCPIAYIRFKQVVGRRKIACIPNLILSIIINPTIKLTTATENPIITCS